MVPTPDIKGGSADVFNNNNHSHNQENLYRTNYTLSFYSDSSPRSSHTYQQQHYHGITINGNYINKNQQQIRIRTTISAVVITTIINININININKNTVIIIPVLSIMTHTATILKTKFLSMTTNINSNTFVCDDEYQQQQPYFYYKTTILTSLDYQAITMLYPNWNWE